LRLLGEHGADPNLPDASGFAPLFRALTEHSRKAVSCLLSLGANPNVRDRSSDSVLTRAAQVSSVGIVRLLVATGADVDARGGTWGTALIAAAARGRRDMFQALLSLGADHGIQDFYGKTANHIEKFGRFKNEIAHVLVRRRLPLPAGFVLAPLAEDLSRKRKRKRTVSLDTQNSQD
jgi:ankyrin repeat protein